MNEVRLGASGGLGYESGRGVAASGENTLLGLLYTISFFFGLALAKWHPILHPLVAISYLSVV